MHFFIEKFYFWGRRGFWIQFDLRNLFLLTLSNWFLNLIQKCFKIHKQFIVPIFPHNNYQMFENIFMNVKKKIINYFAKKNLMDVSIFFFSELITKSKEEKTVMCHASLVTWPPPYET